MILTLYCLFLVISIVSIVCLICSCNEQEQKIKDLEEKNKKIDDLEKQVNKHNQQIGNLDMLLGRFRNDVGFADYTISCRITDLENELKKIKKEIKK